MTPEGGEMIGFSILGLCENEGRFGLGVSLVRGTPKGRISTSLYIRLSAILRVPAIFAFE
jgi:hypothetical protein